MTVVSLCLGLDISPKRLGWALARLEDGAPVVCGCEAIELPANGWAKYRIHNAIREINLRVERDEIHYIAIELPALVAKSGPKSAFMAGRAYQEAYSAVRRRWPWAVVDEFQPDEWKSLAKVDRSAVIVRERMIGPIPKMREIKPGPYLKALQAGFRPGAHQDAADAACIALAGVERNRQTLATPAGEAGR